MADGSMQTQHFCPRCLGERGAVYLQTDINNDDFYDLICPHGHQIYATTNQEKHELLGRQAVEAFIDGYYLQSVSTFAASLERCFEWYVRAVFMDKYGHTSADFGDERLFLKNWRQVERQSERQIGMFVALFALEGDAVAPILNTERSKFRNDIVHNGLIPSRGEAADFGQEIVRLVQTIRGQAKIRHYRAIETIRNMRVMKMAKTKKLGPYELSVYTSSEPYEIAANGKLLSELLDIVKHCKHMRDLATSGPHLYSPDP